MLIAHLQVYSPVFDPQRCVWRATKIEENASERSLNMLRNFMLPIAFDFVYKIIFLFNFIRFLSYIFLNLLKFELDLILIHFDIISKDYSMRNQIFFQV